MTSKMIRRGQLGCVRVGRRRYVTPELMAEFIARNTERPEPRDRPSGEQPVNSFSKTS